MAEATFAECLNARMPQVLLKDCANMIYIHTSVPEFKSVHGHEENAAPTIIKKFMKRLSL